jgi:hypothetical protein
MINEQQLALALGSKKKWASDELLNTLNSIETDDADLVRENWLTHASVLREGNYTLDQYTTAIKYVSLKQMGHTNQSAYSIALADRYTEMCARGYDDRRLSSHISAYHKGALVQKILAQSVVPLHLLFQDEQFKAVHRLATIMTDPNASFKVQVDAANALLTHVKKPESAKVQLEVSHKPQDGMNELVTMMQEVAKKQLNALQSGANVRDVANLPVTIDGECTPVGEGK